MKANTYVEYQGAQIEQKDLLANAKKIWVDMGNKVKDIDTLNLYVKPEEGKVYYVINDDTTGDFSL